MAITILFFTSVFFSPQPQNFISLGLLLPLIVYFWLRTTSPKSTSPNLWSVRVIIVMLIFSFLGILSYSLGAPKQTAKNADVADSTTQKETSDEAMQQLLSKISALSESGTSAEVAEELAVIRKELARISGSKTSQTSSVGGTGGSTLGETTDVNEISKLLEDIPYGFVTIKNQGVSGIDVLDDPVFSASRVGSMQEGENYEFFEKKDGWYLIKLTNGTQGWVNERDVKEVYQ